MKKNILLLVFCLLAVFGFSRTTKGKEFWIGFMENIPLGGNGAPLFRLHVSSNVPTTCTVSTPFTGFTATFAVSPNQVYMYTLPSGNYFPQGDESFANDGIRLIANDSVEVKAFHHRYYFTESTMVLPLEETGTEYLVMAQEDSRPLGPSEFVILATQNNTSVEIIPSVVTVSSRPSNIPFFVTLQQGQIYQLQSMSDLSGTLVRSLDPAKKIALFGGCRYAIAGCVGGGADDHIYEQVFPTSSFGKNYNVVPFSGHVIDIVKILASQNSTTVTVSGGVTYSLSAGEVVTFTISSACNISSNFPIAVSQIATSHTCNGPLQTWIGDPGMISLVPAELTLKKSVFLTFASVPLVIANDPFDLHRLNVVIKTSAIGTLKLDNVTVPSNSFSPVGSGSAYSYARFVLGVTGALQHTLTCDSGFNATIYSFPFANFYGHHLGYHRPDLNPTAMAENSSSVFLAVFPVPAAEVLRIRSGNKIRSVEVVDLLGTVLLTLPGSGNNEIDLSVQNLPDGIYYCIVRPDQAGAEQRTVKFIKAGK